MPGYDERDHRVEIGGIFPDGGARRPCRTDGIRIGSDFPTAGVISRDCAVGRQRNLEWHADGGCADGPRACEIGIANHGVCIAERRGDRVDLQDITGRGACEGGEFRLVEPAWQGGNDQRKGGNRLAYGADPFGISRELFLRAIEIHLQFAWFDPGCADGGEPLECGFAEKAGGWVILGKRSRIWHNADGGRDGDMLFAHGGPIDRRNHRMGAAVLPFDFAGEDDITVKIATAAGDGIGHRPAPIALPDIGALGQRRRG